MASPIVISRLPEHLPEPVAQPDMPRLPPACAEAGRAVHLPGGGRGAISRLGRCPRASGAAGVIVLVVGIGVVVLGADALVDGLLGVGRTLGIAPFVLSVALSGFETEKLAAGMAVNAKGLPGAAAGTFLGA